mgnify:CR=1 FL=1
MNASVSFEQQLILLDQRIDALMARTRGLY